MKKLTVLESLRGFASIYVAIGHFILSHKNIPVSLGFLFRFGQEAVIIFFILSGFVIFYSSSKNQNESLYSYFIKRFRRIYFPLICALIVSIVFVSCDFPIKALVGNLLMLQDFETGKPGSFVAPFLGNAPLWSLSYEWIFYLLFPFTFPVIGKMAKRVHIIGCFSIVNLLIFILFPNHIFIVFAYYIIWWTGLELCEYFLFSHNKSRIQILISYYGIAILLLLITSLVDWRHDHSIKVGIYPYLLLRHYGFALICLLMPVYMTAITKKITKLLKPFALIAPISYGIYILHYPILIQWQLRLPSLIDLPIKIFLVLGLAYIIEVKLQPKINRIFK